MVQIVFGRRGSGKSTLGLHLVRQQVRETRRVGIVVDTLLEHVSLPLVDLENVAHLLSSGYSTTVRVAVPNEDAFMRLREILAMGESQGVILGIDELSYWTKPNATAPGLSDLIRYGRHWRVDLVGIARRAAETSREFTAQADELYVFATHEPRDLAYFGEILPPEAMTKIGSLEQYHYVKYSVSGTWEVCKPIQI
jgi:hypothetical protein